MSKVENTKRPAIDNLLLFVGGGSASDAIERQEAQGQQSFVNSTQLPQDGTGPEQHGPTLEAWGIVLGEPTDDIFREAALPAGWKRVPTDHSMWSDLVDDKGVVRAKIFYKAAFYDRDAHLMLAKATPATA